MRIPACLVAIGAIAASGAPLAFINGADAFVRQNATATADPIALYGQEIQFTVLRNGQEAGWHSVRFGRGDAALTVESTFNLQIEFLFMTVFRYRYQAQAHWREGRMDRLLVRVDDDGKPFALEAQRRGNQLTVKNGENSYSVDAPLYPTNHWNAAVLGENRVLNTLTGRVNRVRIEPVAREAIATERGRVMATRYAYSGDLKTQVWYDDMGRWVKMRFTGRDGSTIDYVCRRCQGGAANEAQR